MPLPPRHSLAAWISLWALVLLGATAGVRLFVSNPAYLTWIYFGIGLAGIGGLIGAVLAAGVILVRRYRSLS